MGSSLFHLSSTQAIAYPPYVVVYLAKIKQAAETQKVDQKKEVTAAHPPLATATTKHGPLPSKKKMWFHEVNLAATENVNEFEIIFNLLLQRTAAYRRPPLSFRMASALMKEQMSVVLRPGAIEAFYTTRLYFLKLRWSTRMVSLTFLKNFPLLLARRCLQRSVNIMNARPAVCSFHCWASMGSMRSISHLRFALKNNIVETKHYLHTRC